MYLQSFDFMTKNVPVKAQSSAGGSEAAELMAPPRKKQKTRKLLDQKLNNPPNGYQDHYMWFGSKG